MRETTSRSMSPKSWVKKRSRRSWKTKIASWICRNLIKLAKESVPKLISSTLIHKKNSPNWAPCARMIWHPPALWRPSTQLIAAPLITTTTRLQSRVTPKSPTLTVFATLDMDQAFNLMLRLQVVITELLQPNKLTAQKILLVNLSKSSVTWSGTQSQLSLLQT